MLNRSMQFTILTIATIAGLTAFPAAIVRAQSPQSWQDTLRGWFDRGGDDDAGNDPPLGGRPVLSGICLITPLPNASLWHDRPLLLWQGEVSHVELRGGAESLPIDMGSDRAISLTALQPGTYSWTVFDKNEQGVVVPFQVMAATDRNSITADLAALHPQDPSPESIALAQAQYFTDRHLWSDALQTALSIENPSPELTDTIQQITNQTCNSVGRSTPQ